MLSDYQKRAIRDLCVTFKKGFVTESSEVNFDFASTSNDAKLKIVSERTNIPASADILEKSIAKLKHAGFSVKIVPPKRANCVLMVYSHDGFEYQNCTQWLYGVDVFFKSLFGMRTLEGLRMKSYYQTEYSFSEKESVKLTHHLVYYHLKIR